MKKLRKIFFIMLCLVLLSGCNEKKNVEANKNNTEENKFVLRKNDEIKDFVYLEEYRNLKLSDGTDYNLKTAVINIKSDDILNVNLELSSFVKKSYKDMKIDNGVVKEGSVIDYVFYETDEYISVLQNYHHYISGLVGEDLSNVFVISKTTGKVIENDEILKKFGYTEESFYEKLESKIVSDDVLYTMKNIKSSGYSLYVNNDGKLVVIYYDVSEEESIRKELIFN